MFANATEAAILNRIIRPERGNLSPDVARELLKLDFEESDHARMAQLSQKAQAGALGIEEREELESYVNVSHFLAFIQSKARLSLKGLQGTSSAA